MHRVRWLGVDIVRGLQALAAGTKRQRRAPQKSTGAAKAFMWNGQVYVDKMATDCDFCVDMLKHDAVGEWECAVRACAPGGGGDNGTVGGRTWHQVCSPQATR